MSKHQTVTALSTTEAKYITLLMVLEDQISLAHLLKEVVANDIDTNFKPSTIHCKPFEDNRGALDMAELPQISPRTKHLNNAFNYF